MKKGWSCLLLMILLLTVSPCLGCKPQNTQEYPNINGSAETSSENILPEEEKDMIYEPLLTKEDLLEFVEMNDNGLNKDDFADINIDDFIEHTRLSKSRLATVNIKNRLDIYKSTLRGRAFDPYKAKEVFSVYSSDEEYELFKNTFINKIGTDMQYIGHTRENIEMFYIKIDAKRVRIHLGQTRNMDNYEVTATSDGSLCITERDSGDTHRNSPFCYSKNKKYFMILQPSLEIMEAFCEIDD